VRRVLQDPDLNPLREKIQSGHYRQIVLILGHHGFADPHNLTENYLSQIAELVSYADFEHDLHVLRFELPQAHQADR
jgi:hypothetical protein